MITQVISYFIVFAQGVKNCQPDAAKNDPSCQINLPIVTADNQALQTMLQIVFGIIGAVAVLIIVLAGLTYSRSLGNPDLATKARRTIVYAVIGLAVAISAEFAVTFLIGRV